MDWGEIAELVGSAWLWIGPWGRAGVVALGAVYVFWAALFIWQSRIIYFTDPTRTHPEEAGLDNAREDEIETPDGERLVLWRADPAWEGAPHIVYLHGNRRALWRRARFFRMFLAAGWGLTALAHRGFNGSTGRPSEKNNVRDAILVCDRLAEAGVDLSKLVVYGESLGSGTAVQVAVARPVGGVILHAPYDSFRDIVRSRTAFLLPRLVFRDRYDSIRQIAGVTAPILWIHGDDDRLIPLARGRRLYDAAPGPKYAALVKGANHFGIYTQQVFNQHIRFFAESVACAAGASDREGEASVIDPVLPDEDARPERAARRARRRGRG
ncbi:alpha/beta hydrolase [Marinicauda salina]|uniref:Alpha/beta hydrolase n=1 Tax=Marinicauda salina TaxID=2135793 RepID=A0A2U2BXA6_9PROT|nr:alpha/beta hydrolase [Marinicauda salina]PWE18651.1 alpha/beta hydrolase [Marinicauda salina]